MIHFYQEFLQLLNAHLIQTENNHLDDLIRKINFHFSTQDNNNNLFSLFQQSCKNNIVVIDGYFKNISSYEFDFEFFLLFTNKNLFIIKESDLSQFFTNSSNISFYLVSDDIKEYKKIHGFPIQATEINDNIILKEIESLSKSFKLIINNKNVKNEKQILTFWDIIIPTISTFLIIKGHLNSKFDRIFHYKEIFDKKNDQLVKYDPKEIIELRNIGSGASAFVCLIYHIPTQKIFALKIFSNSRIDKKTFEREKENYLNVHHPLLPTFLGTTVYQQYEGTIIEYIEGNSLKKYKKK